MKKYIFKGINKIAEYFDEIWVRTSDIRTDEFAKFRRSTKRKRSKSNVGFPWNKIQFKKSKNI